MPKLKTHKASKCRFHVTGTGKIMRMKGGSSHLRRRKSRRAKMLYDEKVPLHPTVKARVKRLIPYD
jgi:large subunit ribosomal protein L35